MNDLSEREVFTGCKRSSSRVRNDCMGAARFCAAPIVCRHSQTPADTRRRPQTLVDVRRHSQTPADARRRPQMLADVRAFKAEGVCLKSSSGRRLFEVLERKKYRLPQIDLREAVSAGRSERTRKAPARRVAEISVCRIWETRNRRKCEAGGASDLGNAKSPKLRS